MEGPSKMTKSYALKNHFWDTSKRWKQGSKVWMPSILRNLARFAQAGDLDKLADELEALPGEK